jgi:hypothetical protein
MEKFVLGIVVGVELLLETFWCYFLSCGVPVATDVLALLIEKYLAKVALHAVLDREMPKTALVKALL